MLHNCATKIPRTLTTLRGLLTATAAAVILAVTACSGEAALPTADIRGHDRGPEQTIEALTQKVETLTQRVESLEVRATREKPRSAIPTSGCDDILRNQFVFQRNASDTDDLNAVISTIQSQRVDQCSVDVWNPEVGTAEMVEATPQTAGCRTPAVLNQEVPAGLHKGGAENPDHVRYDSGRDRENNIIVHWIYSDPPDDGASCWLYIARMSTWSAGY